MVKKLLWLKFLGEKVFLFFHLPKEICQKRQFHSLVNHISKNNRTEPSVLRKGFYLIRNG